MSVAFGSHARERAKKPRTWSRKTWAATLSGTSLTPKRGAWWKTFTPDAELVDEGKDTTSLLIANIGDGLILFGADVDEIALVDVTGVARDGVTLEIKTRYALRPVRDGAVFVMRRSKMSELAQRLERARRKHAAAVLEYQSDPCSTTWLAEFDARKALEAEIEAARVKRG